jgi:hypothetical protein
VKNTDTGFLTVGAGANYVFPAAVSPVIGIFGTAISYNSTTGEFTINEDGVYEVNYGTSSSSVVALTTPLIALEVNNVIVDGTQLPLGSLDLGLLGSVGVMSSAAAILNLTTGEVLTLVNESGFTLGLNLPSPLAPNGIVAYITIQKL